MMVYFTQCRLCPRNCGVDRLSGKRGFCGESSQPRVALATLHRGEEPPLCGTGGSGAVFFSGCTLKCSFCQNCDISRGGVGAEVSPEELASIYTQLQHRGAENLNLVTGTHFLPAIAASLGIARREGLKLPVLWNSSGYENDTGLELIESFTDVYLPDLKTLDPVLAGRLFKAADYPGRAGAAVLRMAAAGGIAYDRRGMLTGGTIVRHLVLPGFLESTRAVLTWFAENLSGKALLSVMFQYLPSNDTKQTAAGPRKNAPSRTIEDAEYFAVLGMLEELGIDDGFIQEPEADSPWLPDFRRDNPFPEEFSTVVWHWKHGYVN